MPRLYIGNLAYSANDLDIIDAFEEMEIQANSVHIPRDRETGQARGFAFVEVDADPQDAVQRMNGKEICGRSIKVDIAIDKPREQRSGSGNHSGGGRTPPGSNHSAHRGGGFPNGGRPSTQDGNRGRSDHHRDHSHQHDDVWSDDARRRRD